MTNKRTISKIWSSFIKDDKKRQILTLILVIIIVLGLLGWVIALVTGQKDQTATETVKKDSEELKIESAGKRVSSEEMWRYNMEEEKKKIQSNIASLQKELQSAISNDRNGNKSEVNILRDELSKLTQAFYNQNKHPSHSNNPDDINENIQLNSGMEKFSLNLTQREGGVQSKTYKNTIATGTFVKAALLGGIDASTAMSSASDPRPILLRLMDEGTISRKWQSDLKDCHVIASGYGDISSERVYARLEKLSCTNRISGKIIETNVSGYVAGEDGRVGIRGKVVSKEGALLANSLVTGILGGLSKVVAQENQLNPFNGDNKFLNNNSDAQQFKKGFGEGASSAVDRLSEYYIEKAEQIQPVVQVSSGRVVDIVFTKSSIIGSTKQKKSSK